MKKVLFVDDEPNVLAAFQRQLRRDFQVETAPGGNEGLAMLENNADFAVVVADMRMPEMNGVEFLAKVKTQSPNVVRMMLTGNADQTTAIEAINEGSIFRFLNKPCSPEKITEALKAAIRQHELITAEKELLENTLKGCVRVLSEILAVADPKSANHTETVRDNVRQLAAHLELENSWQLEVAALLSRIGQVTIPPEVLLKARIGQALSPKEQEMFDQIPAVGGNLLAQIPRLEEVSKMVLYQNKKFDGSGFPQDAVAGNDIPVGARLLKILFGLAELEAKDADRTASLQRLREQPDEFDLKLVEEVATCFQVGSQDGKKPPLAIRFVDLRVGHTLVADLKTRDGTMIVTGGNRITPALIHRLRNFEALSGIKEPIYVEG